MLSLDCRVIFAEFLSEFQKSKLKWGQPRSTWTEKMLGSKKSRKKEDYGIFGKIGKKYGYELQAEWMRIDQVWYNQIDLEEGIRVWWDEVGVEHHNGRSLKSILYVIYKLAEFKARLKIGVFYPKDDVGSVLEQISKVIQKTPVRTENERHLIILGRPKRRGVVKFDAWEFNTRGNKIKVPKLTFT